MHLAQRVLTISVAATLVASCLSFASQDATKFEAPDLQQESQHKKSIQRVVNGFSRYHYKKIELNDELSAKMWERFVKNVDYNKSVFLQSDIDAFSKHVHGFDDAMKLADLSFAFEFYETTIRKRIARLENAIKLLDNKMEFTKQDDFYFDREDTPWAKSTTELDEFWRQKVKFDALNLKLAGKEVEEIKEKLTKRYTNTMRRLSQSQNEDAFQLIMNSYARSIEAHTSYLSPRRADRFQMEMNLELEGIGAVLQPVDEFTVIRSLVPGGPADKTEQLKPEDKIVGVAQGDDDYVDIVGWRLDEVVELIKGKKGTEVRLQIVRGENTATNNKEVKIVRDKVRLEDRAADSSVFESQIGELDAKVGVITIPSFYNNLSNDVKNEIKKLKDQNVDGIVVDLRGNGGGSLSEASLLTGLFIDKGPVVQIRNGVGNVDVRGDYDGIVHYNGPLTVLVDRYSASASEIFSAALQDYGRALVVGEQTFGKGTVQEHRGLMRRFDLFDKKLGSVQFTVAKFYRINGGSTQHKGVIPDILFPSAVEPAEWGESQEENALPWDNIRPAKYTTSRDISNQVKVLTQRHMGRISEEPEFQYLDSDIKEYKEKKDKKFVSLKEADRIAEKDDDKKSSLARLNKRLTRLGFEPVATLDDETPDELDELDPFLEETARIIADLIASGQFAKVTK